MLAGIAGGDAMEIVIALRDLSEVGFKKVEGSIHHLEGTASATNLSGASKAMKTVEKDAEAAAGKKGGGGIGGLASGLLALGGGPVTVALAGLGLLSGVGLLLTGTYEKIEVQEKALAIAAKDHGISMADMNKHVDAAITANENYGIGATDTRDAIRLLTSAGMGLGDQQKAMGPIADLAKAHNISLADAAKQYELATMGNQKALKDLGIVLPKITDAQAKHYAATHHLTTAQAEAALKAERLTKLNAELTKKIGDQRNATTPMEIAQAKLGDTWQRLATAVGPGLADMFSKLITGLSRFLDGALKVAGVVGDKLAPVFRVVSGIIGGFADVVRKAFGILGDLLGQIGKVGGAIASSPIGSLLGGGGDALRNLAGMIPHFASGGMVSRPTLALIGEGGEREFVIPESKMGGMGGGAQNITVHSHLYLDGDQILDHVERGLGRRLNNRGTSATSFGGA